MYCDNRKTLSHPEIRSAIRDGFVAKIREKYPDATGIAGVATGAIAQAALVAEAMNLPMIYIRDKAKGHGMENLLEGEVDPLGKYVVIEDLISTGGSSAKAVKALQATGATVLGTLAIFSYGFPQAVATFAETGTPFSSLTSLEVLLAKAIEIRFLSPDQEETVLRWKENPQSWQG